MPFPLLATTPISSPLSSKNPLRQPTKSANTRPSPTSLRLPNSTTISCEQKQVDNNNGSHGIDRRNVLLGLGGLYGATSTMAGKVANAVDGGPVQPPDLSMCILATDSQADDEPVNCCPPYSTSNIVDFVLPPDAPLRHRKPAHKLSPKEIERFKVAIAKMKQLDPKDPWNFMQQATIHCTFCNGAFFQVNYPDKLLQVHATWLFAPWHRYYLYFWERILGKLIDDPTFAIPYWNWDVPDGMFIPSFYLDNSSPLYNDKRNHDHYKALMDFDYKNEPTPTPNPTPDQYKDVINKNLQKVENLFNKDNLNKPDLFMGAPVSAGEFVEVRGALEELHNLAHEWVGPVAKPNHDMGNFYTAARDTLFWAHHGNVDRLWDFYQKKRMYKPESNLADYLEASFIFYDENRQVVKVKVSDCLRAEDLGYTYAPEEFPWQGIRRRNRKEAAEKKKPFKKQLQLVPVSEFGNQPRPLDDVIRVLVPRPKISRSKQEKEDDVEVLVVDNIQLDPSSYTKFDVYISKPIAEGLAAPDYGEFAGRYSRIPHIHNKKFPHAGKAKLQIGITELLEDINAESAESLVVTLVPKMGYPSIGRVFIELQEADY
ncbi:hypothetical protein Sjap_000146 [Stephania japonica]|uniref:Polyphenol oxidase n=1 Tax=Stephania japonica TaxID=461633 RepID=A0AAP0PTR3_9MAGN